MHFTYGFSNSSLHFCSHEFINDSGVIYGLFELFLSCLDIQRNTCFLLDWYGSEKPFMLTYLQPIMEQLNHLYYEGMYGK